MEILGNRNLLSILEEFIAAPNREFSQREVVLATKLARMTVKRWLEFLVKHDALTERRQGVNKLFRLNRANSVIKQIKVLNTLTQIRDTLAKLAKDYNFEAYLYGSAARGEDESGSDIDILIIGKLEDKSKVIHEIKKLGAEIKREITSNVYTKSEWAMAARKDRAFYERVQAEGIKIE